MLCATAFLSSCHIYKSYDRPEDIDISGLYRDTVAGGDTLVSDTNQLRESALERGFHRFSATNTH